MKSTLQIVRLQKIDPNLPANVVPFCYYSNILNILIMACTGVRCWGCCHGCSKLSSQFKISKLCISATHMENPQSRGGEVGEVKIIQGLAQSEPSPISSPWAHLSPVSGYWCAFFLPDDHLAHHFLQSTLTPQAGKAAEHKQAGKQIFFPQEKA